MKTFNPINKVSAILLLLISTCAIGNPVGEAQRLYSPLPDEVIPALSKAGKWPVAVRTITVVNKVHYPLFEKEQKPRELVLEVWYPASQQGEPALYENVMRSHTPFSIIGSASRDSEPAKGSYPLIILSHGYTGYRHLMYYLAEHLASHGYVVAAIDHTDSTNQDINIQESPYAGFPSTLYNRSRDQQFVLEALTEHTQFSTVIDDSKVGLIGYSMGGYGAVATAGGCYAFDQQNVATFTGVTDAKTAAGIAKKLNTCSGGNQTEPDGRWAAVVALAPWGGQHQLFSPKSLNNIAVPILYVVGEFDDISGYDGVTWLYKQTQNNQTKLLTIDNARHNIAGHPAPAEAYNHELDLGHYYEPAWQTQALNNIVRHFSSAQMNCYLKDQKQSCKYLAVQGNSNEVDAEGKTTPAWPGFNKRYGLGLRMDSK